MRWAVPVLAVCLVWAGAGQADDTDADGVQVTPLGGGKFVVSKAPRAGGNPFEATIETKEADGKLTATTVWKVREGKDIPPRDLKDGEKAPLTVVLATRLERNAGRFPTAKHVEGTEFVIVGYEEDVARSEANLKYLAQSDDPQPPTKGKSTPEVSGGDLKVIGYTVTKLNGQVRSKTAYMSDGTARRVYNDGKWLDLGQTPLPSRYEEGDGGIAFGEKLGNGPALRAGGNNGGIARDTPRNDPPKAEPPAVQPRKTTGYFTYQGKTYLRQYDASGRGRLYELC